MLVFLLPARVFTGVGAKAAATETSSIVFYGDSITADWEMSRFFPGRPYVTAGGSGLTSRDLDGMFREQVLNRHPFAVLVLAGTNDIAGNHGGASFEESTQHLRSITDQARSHGIRIILSSILPVADYPWNRGLNPAPKVRALNAWISAYCRTERIGYVDYYSAMAAPDGGMRDGLSKDGVHPTDAGYAIMTGLAQAAIDVLAHTSATPHAAR